jgi:HEAT repeat protein
MVIFNAAAFTSLIRCSALLVFCSLTEIRSIGAAPTPVVPLAVVINPLIERLKDKDEKVQLQAIAALERMGADAKEAGADIVEYGLMSSSSTLRQAAANALEKIDPRVSKDVITIVIDSNDSRRLTSIHTLSLMGPNAKTAVPAIKGYLSSSSGFGKWPSLRGKEKSPHWNSPSHGFLVFKELASIAPDDEFVIATTIAIVGAHEDSFRYGVPIRKEAIHLLTMLKIDNNRKFEALMKALTVVLTKDRPLVISELARLGPDAKAAIRTLTELKLHHDLAVREAASKAIAKIDPPPDEPVPVAKPSSKMKLDSKPAVATKQDVVANPEPANQSVQEQSKPLPLLAKIGIGLLLAFALACAIYLSFSRCEKCRAIDEPKEISRHVIDETECYGLVTRTARTYGGGMVAGRPGFGSGSTSWQERVPMVRVTTRTTYRCSACRHETFKDKVEEFEDFDRA